MGLLRDSLKGSFTLSAGQAVSYLCSFVRLMIFARIMERADFGTAATFTLVIGVLEMGCNMSLNIVIVQAKDGNRPSFQATCHALQIVRGVFMALVLILCAPLVADLFGVSHARWAFATLALVPLLRGFNHLDTNRVERRLNFAPRVLTELVPQLIVTLAALPVTYWLRDYTAALWLLMAKSAMTLAATHMMASRPYRLSWQQDHFVRVFRFGWPLLINGLFLSFMTQGDQFVTGSFYGINDLATYSVAVALATACTTALAQVTNPLFLPILSRVQQDSDSLAVRYKDAIRTHVLLAALVGPFFILLGESAVVLLYGEKYRAAGILIAWIGAAQALKLIRIGTQLPALAKGDTVALLISNMVGVIGFAFALVFGLFKLPLTWIAASAVLGELAALAVTVQQLLSRHGLRRDICYRTSLLAIAGMIAASAIFTTVQCAPAPLLQCLLMGLWTTVCAGVAYAWFGKSIARNSAEVI